VRLFVLTFLAVAGTVVCIVYALRHVTPLALRHAATYVRGIREEVRVMNIGGFLKAEYGNLGKGLFSYVAGAAASHYLALPSYVTSLAGKNAPLAALLGAGVVIHAGLVYAEKRAIAEKAALEAKLSKAVQVELAKLGYKAAP